MTRSENVIFIEITLNVGRTVEIKKELYAGIASRLERVGVRPDDVVISLIEVTKENWSFGGGPGHLRLTPAAASGTLLECAAALVCCGRPRDLCPGSHVNRSTGCKCSRNVSD